MLGQKIRELRLQKKMTQAQLAENIVTRNMLSQIENGVAQPSLTTMIEIAERLDAPVEYFLSESGDLAAFRKITAIGKIKKVYAAGDYKKCLSRLVELDAWDDETELLAARASLACGIEKYRAGMLASALTLFEAASAHAEKTLYAEAALNETAMLYRAAVEFVRGEKLETAFCDETSERPALLPADIAYLRAIAGEKGDFAYGEELCAEYLAARTLPDAEATEKLRGILERCDEEHHAVLLYYVLCELEKLSERAGDYKCAYECSSRRRALTEQMNR